MRIHRRFHTIFHRLVFSYILLIILTAILMGIASYLYFSNHFNREIQKAHEVTLENVSPRCATRSSTVLVKTYAELTENKLNAEHVLFFFTNPVKPHNAKICEAHSYRQYLFEVHLAPEEVLTGELSLQPHARAIWPSCSGGSASPPPGPIIRSTR